MLSRICLVLLCLCSTSHAQARDYEAQVVADNLNFPWSVAFLPNGDVLITELVGRVRMLQPSGHLSEPLNGVPNVYRAGQGGLFDVIADPDFANNQTVYLSYAAGDVTNNRTTVARAKLVDNELQSVSVIYRANPSKYAPLHYGGRLAWRTPSVLLLTTGDGFDFREQAQNLDSDLGKTVQLITNDTTEAQLPFPDKPHLFTYGHRNPQGLAVARDGTIYQHEHGPRGGDEVNVLTPGTNYGWPAITYGMDYNGAYVSPFTEHPGMAQPIHVWDPSIGPSGLMIYEGDMFPEWQGNLFVGALVDEEVRRLTLVDGAVTSEASAFAEIGARIRDIREAPDGSIYIVTDGEGGQVIRISRGE